MEIEDILTLAENRGWGTGSKGRINKKCARVEALTLSQKELLGAKAIPGTMFGGRFPNLNEGSIHVAGSWTNYRRDHGYIGHCCDLYCIPSPEGYRLAAWCFNWHFSCQLGEMTRKAFESGDITGLPLVCDSGYQPTRRDAGMTELDCPYRDSCLGEDDSCCPGSAGCRKGFDPDRQDGDLTSDIRCWLDKKVSKEERP